VEIDRGTMPITRANFEQTSFERKMRVYLAAHAAKQHEHQLDEAWTQLGAVQSALLQNQLDAAKKSLADWQTR